MSGKKVRGETRLLPTAEDLKRIQNQILEEEKKVEDMGEPFGYQVQVADAEKLVKLKELEAAKAAITNKKPAKGQGVSAELKKDFKEEGFPDEIKTEAMNQGIGIIYLAKATQLKYVQKALKYLANMSDEELMIIAEANKKVVIALVYNDEFKKKFKLYTQNNPFVGSRPTKAMIKAQLTINSVLSRNNCPDEEEISWGSFVQAFEERLKPAFFMTLVWMTPSESFHFSRTFYAMMTGTQCIEYVAARQILAGKAFDFAIANWPELKNAKTRKEMGAIIKANFTPLASLKPAQEFFKKLSGTLCISPDLSKAASIEEAILGALPVDFRYVLQNKAFRVNNFDQADLNFVKEVYNFPIVKVKGESARIKSVVEFMNKEEPTRIEYFACSKVVKGICSVLKGKYKGGRDAGEGNSAKRDYSRYKA